MSQKFRETCKDHEVIARAIKTIEDHLEDQSVLCYDGQKYNLDGKTGMKLTHFYSIQSRDELERIKEELRNSDERH